MTHECKQTHTHTHTYTHIHTHTQTHTDTRKHTHKHTYTHKRTVLIPGLIYSGLVFSFVQCIPLSPTLFLVAFIPSISHQGETCNSQDTLYRQRTFWRGNGSLMLIAPPLIVRNGREQSWPRGQASSLLRKLFEEGKSVFNEHEKS